MKRKKKRPSEHSGRGKWVWGGGKSLHSVDWKDLKLRGIFKNNIELSKANIL